MLRLWQHYDFIFYRENKWRKKEHYPLETITKKKKYHTNRNNENVGIQENQIKINFLNSIKVSFGEEVILKEKFI